MLGAGPELARPGAAPAGDKPTAKSDALTDLALTMPIFVLYHLGVAFLPIRNAADPVTAELRALAKHSLPLYAGLTVAVGAAFVLVLSILGRGHALQTRRFALLAAEGALYAILMRFAGSYVVGSLRLGPPAASNDIFTGVVMSLGAGFYEEIAFRVGLYGLGALGIKFFFGKGVQGVVLMVGWAVVAAAVFSGWHYVGSLGDPWNLPSFVFRMVCGLVLTAIYVFRGFAPAVWTHALYDVWVLVLR
ncbi:MULTISPECIES: CPBP family glutamic-type intramembrane protease [Sorangium]|uniref:CPBP family glutamic-type intramembrane protease n=1 Tax=Sorangium atrum TaxID=2995308 RepID=A0ABT5CBE0_9BACT|nr:CPBP family glutamic-type intramembrane protease [Sorangium aterium]MDC0683697.1 CPBP family glutamic-type intramembrane protease [Sorangium aterium]